MRLVYGVGINDADYPVHPVVEGKRVKCLIYQTWLDMIRRCYDEKWQAKSQTYIGCIVCNEWLTFSKFKSWMEQQDWQGHQLDKDILFNGNKVYHPDRCVFVNAMTNSFIVCHASDSVDLPVGVHLHKQAGKFKAQCCNPFTKKQEHIGLFDCQHKAHEAWRKRKHELACQLADLQTDVRVSTALRLRYA